MPTKNTPSGFWGRRIKVVVAPGSPTTAFLAAVDQTEEFLPASLARTFEQALIGAINPGLAGRLHGGHDRVEGVCHLPALVPASRRDAHGDAAGQHLALLGQLATLRTAAAALQGDGARPGWRELPGVLGTVTRCATTVTNGLVLLELDFGEAFAGEASWLQLGIAPAGACDGSTVYEYPSPLLPVGSAPNALFARQAGDAAQEQVAFDGVKVAAGRVAAQRPAVWTVFFPGRESQR